MGACTPVSSGRTLFRVRSRGTNCPGVTAAILCFCVALLGVVGPAVTPALAEHFNRATFIPAYQRCDPALANATTSNGVAACTPAVPVSNCATDAPTALVLGGRGGGAITYRQSGRREAQVADGAVDLLTKVALKDVRLCSGKRFSGNVTLAISLRMFRQDSVCGASGCVIPEFTLLKSLPCKRGRCKLVFRANELLAADGKPPFPSDQVFTSVFPSIKVLDRANRPFLTLGLQAGRRRLVARATDSSSIRAWLTRLLQRIATPSPAYAYVTTVAGRASLSLSRYVQAYEPCDPGATDVVTSDGVAACSPVPLSNCSTDPDNAIRVTLNVAEDTNTGRGKVNLTVKKTLVKIRGDIAGIERCDGTPYSGPLQLDIRGSATLDDPQCGTDLCTTVETTVFGMPIDLTGGQEVIKAKRDLSTLGPFPGSASTLNLELTTGRMLDRSGNVALVAPASLVRCSQHITAAGTPFCFSN